MFFIIFLSTKLMYKEKTLCRSDISWLCRVWDRFLLTWIRFLRPKREGGGGLIIKLAWRKKKGCGKLSAEAVLIEANLTGFALNKRGGKYQQEFWGLPKGKFQGISNVLLLSGNPGRKGEGGKHSWNNFPLRPFFLSFFPGHWGILIKSTMTKQKWRFYLLVYMYVSRLVQQCVSLPIYTDRMLTSLP